MTPLLWFGAALAAAFVYSIRTRSRISPALQLDWRAAVVCVVAVVIGATVSLRIGIGVTGRTALVTHTAALFLCSWLGLQYWSGLRAWKACVPLLALACSFAYANDRFHWNNAVVLLAVLAVVPAAMHLTRGWAYVVYLSFAALDSYAVWGSDVMQRITAASQPSFPSGLVLTQSVAPLLRPMVPGLPAGVLRIQQDVAWVLVSLKEIGFLDLVMSCLAVALIVRFSGARVGMLAVVALLSCAVGVGASFIWGLLPVHEIPFLLFVAPVTVAFLAVTGRSGRPVHSGASSFWYT